MQPLTAIEANLLELEDRRGVHMHCGCTLLFSGAAPSLERFKQHVRSRLDLTPRYRQRVVSASGCLHRAAWIDDPLFELDYHVREAALPSPADDATLRELIGALLSQRLDHGKPLWELWLLGPLAGERFAVFAKSHAALIDGDPNLELLSVLLEDPAREPPAAPPPAATPPAAAPAAPAAWSPPPPPSRAQLALGLLASRRANPLPPLTLAGGMLARLREELQWRQTAGAGGATPPCLLNRSVGLTRSYATLEVGLGRLRRERERLGGTVNDAVLTAVAGALGRYLRHHGEDTDGLVLRALLPLADAASPGLLASHVPLPVGIADPRRRHAEISRALDGLHSSGRARAARELTALDGFPPPTLLGQAARLAAGQHAFNVVVTNVPGPLGARELLGAELRGVLGAVPLAPHQTLSVTLVSHRGRLHFGLLADSAAIGDLDLLAGLLEDSLGELRKGARGKQASREAAVRVARHAVERDHDGG
jgi:WS/DGAT/MGAT family acyltransferase